MSRSWLLGFLLAAGVTIACTRDNLSSREAQSPPEPDRVVSVTIACTYQTREGPSPSLGTLGDPRPVVPREGTGEYCAPTEPQRIGAIVVLQVTNRRAQITVRTATGGSYTAETTDLTVKVGDTWPR